MKIMHLSDLHLGKRMYEFSMIEDQRMILSQILEIIDRERPQAVLLAGDLYDKAIPSIEAVELLDSFLNELTARHMTVLAISGNHDSGARLCFGRHLMQAKGVYLAGSYDGAPERVTLEDEHGPVHFYLLPFVRVADVRPYLKEEAETLQDALTALFAQARINTSARNVLVAHQFVTAGTTQPYTCDSETIAVGGADNVDVSVFSAFDYVALGHLHRPQQVGRSSVRYCGTPLKYSFSEWMDQKSVTLVEMGEKGALSTRIVPLQPHRDVREVRGTLAQLLRSAEQDGSADYMHVVLTDEEDLLDPMAQIRQVYPNVMHLSYDNSRTRAAGTPVLAQSVLKSPFDLFCEFYMMQNGAPLDERRQRLTERILGQDGGAER